jgi:hypothetical protein
MASFWIGYSMFGGVILAALLWACADVWRNNSRVLGLLFSAVVVVAPLAALAVYDLRIAIFSTGIACFILALGYYCWKQEQLNLGLSN